MDLELRDKRFVVGGGSKGLGRGIAQVLVDEGARVVLLSRGEDELRSTAEAMGDAASYVAADMADPAMPEKVRSAVDQHLGGLDGAVMNAGGPPAGQVLDLSDEQWAGAFELLIGGPIRLLRTLVPLMDSGGALLWVTSSSVRQPVPNLDTSNVLRPGVAAMVKCLARELGPAIRVNSMAPGRFDTDRVRSLDDARAEQTGTSVEDQRAEWSKTIPLGRYGEPAEFGRVGAFLLSPAASYVSGISVQVDGALVIAIP